jgi:septal ring factor EnvC (AmiA/AmiB activator)
VRQQESDTANRHWEATQCQGLTDAREQLNKTLAKDERRHLQARLKRLETQLKRRQKQRTRSLEKARRRMADIQTQIKTLDDQLSQHPQQTGRLERLIKEGYHKLNFAPKAFMDAIKITARNLFFRLHRDFRHRYNNYRHDHVILRELTRTVGSPDRKSTRHLSDPQTCPSIYSQTADHPHRVPSLDFSYPFA